MNKAIALTTIDNPWSFFNNFDEWLQFDTINHYNCCGIVARLSNVSQDMTEKEKEAAVREAIINFVKEDPTTLYTIVEEESEEPV